MNYDLIGTKVNRQDKQAEILAQFRKAGDTVSITDALLNIGRGGSDVLVFLAEEGVQRKFYIEVLCDRWGKPVKDEDVVEWTVDKGNKDEFKQKMNARLMREMVRRGDGARFTDRYSAVVRNGCIHVDRKAAVQLLNLHGVAHTGSPLSRLREVGSAEKIMPDGETGHVHNWRFMEIPASEYAEREEAAKLKELEAKKKAKEKKVRQQKADKGVKVPTAQDSTTASKVNPVPVETPGPLTTE